jgi:hypothetical protein
MPVLGFGIDLTRRAFLGGSSRLAAFLTVYRHATGSPGLLGQAPPASSTALAALRRMLEHPPHAAKPMTRWWWFGGAITRDEITRELTFMRDAGLRGAEIQPVYPVEVDDPVRGIRHLRYFSPEWFDVLRHAVVEARRLELQLDFTLGSGWPYGGPFVPAGLSARRLRVLSQDVAGPREFSWNVTPLITGDDRVVATVAVPVALDGSPDLTGAQVLPDQPHAAMANNARVGMAVDRWQVPTGHWRVMLVLDTPTGMQVKRPTLGMEGLVIDHHNRDATDVFLRSAGDRVLAGLGVSDGPPFASVFCDSLEVYGADWSGRLLPEFTRRRGYDLTPYLPALFHDSGPLTPHVRYDYHLTLSDLILDEFFAPLVAWADRHGMQARIQAHGAMGDVMRGYSLAHIPEGENIFLGDRYIVNLKHRRLASSAAHVYEKPLVSAETYTWLRTPVYTTTLEMMKAATDATLLDGINHIVNHGYSYSPPEAGEPGWAFYASTEVNHTNTWWRHYPHLAGYVQRACALVREGVSVNRVGVYLPVADVYAGVGAGALHIDVEVERHVDAALLDGIRRAGYDFDLLTDHVLTSQARVEDGELRAGTGRYRAVLVPETRFMPPESADRIAQLALAGGHVILIGTPPQEAPGVVNREARSAATRAAFERVALSTSGGGPGNSVRGVRAVQVPDTPAALQALQAVLPADVTIVHAAGPDDALQSAVEHVGFTHRRLEQTDCYVVANISDRSHDLRARFDVGHRTPERWDLEGAAGRNELPYVFASNASGQPVTEVELRLGPFESCAIVFGSSSLPPIVTHTDPRGDWSLVRRGGAGTLTGHLPASGEYRIQLAGGRMRRVSAAYMPQEIAVNGRWALKLGLLGETTLETLRSWGDLPGGKGFSGCGVYDTDIEVPDLGQHIDWTLDLGIVHETAEARLNGKNLGAAWKGIRRLPCGEALVRGVNHIRIEVANLWIHHVLAHPPGDPARHLKGVGPDPAVAETVGIRWGTYGEVAPEAVPPSGLLGPVRLVPLRRVTVDL